VIYLEKGVPSYEDKAGLMDSEAIARRVLSPADAGWIAEEFA
jgi:hypothetical protein